MSKENPPNSEDDETAGNGQPAQVAEPDKDVPYRDTLPVSGLIERLEALSPVVDDRKGASVRVEILGQAEELRARIHYWRALVAASIVPNPWLEPAAVLSYLDIAALASGQSYGPPPKFFAFWRDSGPEDPFRDRRMVALLPFTPARKGAEGWFGAALGWRFPGGLATPLVHRQHQRAVAAALSHWLKSGDAGYRLLTLEGTGPDELWRAQLAATAEATGVRLDTIGDAPDCAFAGAWSELFSLSDGRRRRELPRLSEDIDVFTPATLDKTMVADAVAYEAAWHGQLELIGQDDDWIADQRFAHFSLAQEEGRLFIGRGYANGRVRAVVLALKSGPDAVLAGVSVDPRQASEDQRAVVRRVLKGLQTRISTYAGISRLRTGPYADDVMFADLFADRIARDTVTLSVRRFSGASVWPLFGRRRA